MLRQSRWDAQDQTPYTGEGYPAKFRQAVHLRPRRPMGSQTDKPLPGTSGAASEEAGDESEMLDLANGASCCATVRPERKALAVDADRKARNLKRLRRIEGQVRGLQKMIEDDRYCADIMTQISSVHEALRSVGRELMRNHLKHCAASAIAAGGAERDAMYDELVDMMYRHSR